MLFIGEQQESGWEQIDEPTSAYETSQVQVIVDATAAEWEEQVRWNG